tara:strand:+ start:544 stop:1413 length:870 start_codon:yes stop_codon:yes gene_type:complete
MNRILIAGATGMLGTSLSAHLRQFEYEVISHGFITKADINFDFTDKYISFEFLDKIMPDFIINLICLSDVDLNEKDNDLANKLNVESVKNISEWISNQKTQIRFIHVSTDHLYDNAGFNKENNVTCRNIYASTKYYSEKISAQVDACILRTNFFGKSQNSSRKSFSDWVESNVKDNIPMNLFNDVYFTPLSLETLCRMINHVVKNFKSGTYNLGSNGGMSKSEFAKKLISSISDKKVTVKDISIDDMDFTATRPKGMMMDVLKFEKYFRVKLPTLESEIKTHIESIRKL